MNMVVHNHSSTVIGRMYEGPKNGDFVRYVDQLLADNARKAGVVATLPSLPAAARSPGAIRQPQAGSTVDAATQLLERLKQAAKAKEAAGKPRTEVWGREPVAQAPAGSFNWAKLLGWLFMLGLAIALPPVGILLILHFVGKHLRAAKK
ncbi:hypothetical protein GCM10027082_28950 [Comamonas humi]